MDFDDYPILYVDDEHANRVVMKHALGQQFRLLIAESGAEAKELLEREHIAVLLTDQRMPGMTGVDLAEQVLQSQPEIVRVIITAYSDLEATIDAINRAQVNRFIKKPWTREELVAVMQESIQSYHKNQLIKKLQQRLMKLDRMTALAVMASAIAHDLRQPLGYIVPTLEALELEVKQLKRFRSQVPGLGAQLATVEDILGDLRQGFDKFEVVSSTLLESLRNRKVAVERMDLKKALQSAVAITHGTIIRRAIFEQQVPEGPLEMVASEGRVIQLMVNLLLNAVQAIEEGAQWRNQVGLSVSADEKVVRIAVRDTGCGIPQESLNQIFVPLYTTKGESGSGLGLAICKQIVDEMGGTIDVESQLEQGTRFGVTLPRWSRPADQPLK